MTLSAVELRHACFMQAIDAVSLGIIAGSFVWWLLQPILALYSGPLTLIPPSIPRVVWTECIWVLGFPSALIGHRRMVTVLMGLLVPRRVCVQCMKKSLARNSPFGTIASDVLIIRVDGLTSPTVLRVCWASPVSVA